jgi:hypothetical protein
MMYPRRRSNTEERWSWRRATAAVMVVLLTAAVAPGCSSSDSGGNAMETVPCVQLVNTTTPATETVVAEDGSSGECELLWVDLIVTNVDDLFAANFVVNYPSDLVQFVQASDTGSVLASGGVAVEVLTDIPSPGTLTVGLTRLAGDGVNVSGGQLLVRLIFFRLQSNGSGQLSFDSPQLLDDSTPPQVILDGSSNLIPWYGGTVAIVQI